METFRQFKQIWLCDFEFSAPSGQRPEPVCLVAREFQSGHLLRLGRDELDLEFLPPFHVGSDSLFVAYYATAELGCLLSLGWPLPSRVLDLFCEFRCLTNGLPVPCGNGLLGALAYYGIASIEAAEKEDMRRLAMRGGEYTAAERSALLDYCQSDVDALAKLLPAMLPAIDLPRALLRGRYMAAAARMEHVGTPIDVELLSALRDHWEHIKASVIQKVNASYSVYIPAGVEIDPDSVFGATILRVADEYGIDAHTLALAVNELWQQERDAIGEQAAALKAARKSTGLSARRIDRLEDAGFDHSAVAHLDDTARDLASEFSELGITGAEDQGAELWSLLREPVRRSRPKHDASLVREAAELVVSHGSGGWSGPWRFSSTQFAKFLVREGIPWPRLESGALALDDETFRQMARKYPAVAPIRELRHTLGELRLFDLAVGRDGRNRCLLSPFRSTTGRNQPSNTEFIFGPSCWLRALIKPPLGRAVSYVDWSQQEFGIAAALSSDSAMMEAYASGNPYLTFAKQAKAVPANATKKTHGAERDRFKVCALAVQYGMGPASLSQSLGQPEAYARELLRLHRETYPRFWKWSEAAVNHAMLKGYLWTVFGWRVRVGAKVNPRSLANFPVQANGAEMLRLACCLATERDIEVCAPVHDALMIQADIDEIDDAVETTRAAMAEASRTVLGGFELRTDAKVVRHPERYMDPRGERMFEAVVGILAEHQPAEAHYPYLPGNTTPVHSY